MRGSGGGGEEFEEAGLCLLLIARDSASTGMTGIIRLLPESPKDGSVLIEVETSETEEAATDFVRSSGAVEAATLFIRSDEQNNS